MELETRIVDIDVDNTKMQFKAEPTTEIIATMLATEDTYGTVIYANVQTPDEAIKNKAKYEPLDLHRDYLDVVWENLSRIGSMLSDGESISAQLKDFLEKRAVLIQYRQRLQDVPMLQVLARYEEFAKYIKAYEKLLTAINDDFPKISSMSYTPHPKYVLPVPAATLLPSLRYLNKYNLP